MRNLRKRALVLFLLLSAAGLAFVVFDNPRPVDDAYAQWGAVDMVIDYMEEHDGKWPPDWESLRPDFQRHHGRVGWSFEEFQRRIVIDFRLNSEDLRRQAVASERVTFRAIHARSRLAATMGEGPNATLHRYFRTKSGILEAPTPPGSWASPRHKQLADEWYRRGFHVRFDDHGEIVSAWTGLFKGPRPQDKEIVELRTLPKLQELNLVGSETTDAGLEVVRHLPDLPVLDLGSDKITDAGLDHLVRHPSLESLDLFGTQISDAGLVRLNEIPKLREIRFDARRISSKAVKTLTTAMPDLKIRPEGELRALQVP